MKDSTKKNTPVASTVIHVTFCKSGNLDLLLPSESVVNNPLVRLDYDDGR